MENYENLQNAQKEKILFESQIKTLEELRKIRKLLEELLVGINKRKK